MTTTTARLSVHASINADANKNTRVLIVDDSAVVRKILNKILSSDPRIDVVGTAPDPFIARDKIKLLNPDVITLDIEMPKMDGITFLRNLMRLRPTPVVMISSLSVKGADVTLDALALGAVDFVTKPAIDLSHSLQDYAHEITQKVMAAASVKVQVLANRRAEIPIVEQKLSADSILAKTTRQKHIKTTEKVIAIGSSTGGTEAIKEVLVRMPPDAPGIVITQHIPPVFSTSFAERMNSLSQMVVCEASDGQQILAGHAYIAPGDQHLLLIRDGARYLCKLSNGAPVNRHKPSVDVLFRSVAQNAGQNAIGIILTGMGDDGARGMKEMHDAGIPTIVQDENTSVVWGMPGSAVKHGGVDNILPLNKISTATLKLAKSL